MRETVARMVFFAMSAFAVGISPEVYATLATMAAIVAGWIFLEYRIERIVKRELKAHTDVETVWQKSVEEKLDTLLQKRRG